jgi:hypothetical protein
VVVNQTYPPRDTSHDAGLVERLFSTAAHPRHEGFDDALVSILDDLHPALVAAVREHALAVGAEELSLANGVFLRLLHESLPWALGREHLGVERDLLTTAKTAWVAHLRAVHEDQSSLAQRQRALEPVLRDLRAQIVAAAERRLLQATDRALQSITSLPSGEEVLIRVRTALVNALLLLMDQPIIGASALGLARRFEEAGTHLRPPLPPPAGDAAELAVLVSALRHWANRVMQWGNPELAPWSTAVRHLADGLDHVDTSGLGRTVGQWRDFVGPCPMCGMHCASCVCEALDSTGTFLRSKYGSDWLRIPAGLNRVTCQFCEYETCLEAPMVAYWPDRGCVIYCLPEVDGVSPENLPDLYRLVLGRIRNRYAGTLSGPEQSAYWASPELIAYGWERFVFLIQMGESISQDHIYQVRVRPDGSGYIHDPVKRFERELTVAEVAQGQTILTETVRYYQRHPVDLSGAGLWLLTPAEEPEA